MLTCCYCVHSSTNMVYLWWMQTLELHLDVFYQLTGGGQREIAVMSICGEGIMMDRGPRKTPTKVTTIITCREIE